MKNMYEVEKTRYRLAAQVAVLVQPVLDILAQLDCQLNILEHDGLVDGAVDTVLARQQHHVQGLERGFFFTDAEQIWETTTRRNKKAISFEGRFAQRTFKSDQKYKRRGSPQEWREVHAYRAPCASCFQV